MRVWLVGRTAADDVEELAEVFPSVTFTGLTLDDRSARGSSPAHGLVLSLLADLMRDVERAVLLPAGSRIAGDIGSLAGIDLRGNALAAANMEGRNANSGFGVLHGASLRGAQAGRAEEFRRQAYQRHTFVFGPNPCVLPDSWAVAPTRMPVDAEPELLYWPDTVKPSDRWNVQRSVGGCNRHRVPTSRSDRLQRVRCSVVVASKRTIPERKRSDELDSTDKATSTI